MCFDEMIVGLLKLKDDNLLAIKKKLRPKLN